MNWKKNKATILLCSLFLCLLVVVAGYGILSSGKDDSALRVDIIEVDTDKFGYKIIRDERVVIMQPFVPGKSRKMFFCKSSDAKKVGELVKERMKNGKELSITNDDLIRLGITSFAE